MNLGISSRPFAGETAPAVRSGKFHARKGFACFALITVTALWPDREQRAEE